jgi:translocation and assembly module TamB
MKIGKLKISKNTVVISVILIITALAFLLLRGPYTSNVLKMAVLSRFQEATGLQAIVKKIHINLLPPFIEAGDVKVFDVEGTRIYEAERIKAYIGIQSILRRQVDVKRIVMVRPRLWAERAQAEEILNTVKKHSEKRESLVRFSVNAVVVKDGEMSFHDEENEAIVTASGTEAEILLRDKPRIVFNMKEIAATVGGWPDMKGSIGGTADISENAVEFRDMNIRFLGSDVRWSGNYSMGNKGDFVLGADLLINSIKDIMNLKNPGEGNIRVDGTLKLLGDFKNPFIDFKLKGSVFLETLMEFITGRPKAKVGGLANFDGKLTGHISDLEGAGSVWMKKGRFYGVDIDDAKCKVGYKDGLLSFKQGETGIYGGEGKVEVAIAIPQVRPYMVKVSFKDADITKTLGLIGLSKLKLSPGKVSGELYSSGMSFNPEGWAIYNAGKRTENAIGRIQKITGNYKKTGSWIALSSFDVSTGTSHMKFDGGLDLLDRTLDFYGSVNTDDVNDLILPYYKRIKGRGKFRGTVKGTIEDPLIEGNLRMSNAYLDEYVIGDVEGDVSYRKNLFVIKRARGESGQSIVEANGSIEFPTARKLLDLIDAHYNVDIALDGADLKGILKVFRVGVPIGGNFDSTLTIRGEGLYPSYAGPVSVSDAVVYGRQVSNAEFDFRYDSHGVAIRNAVLARGDSELLLDGQIMNDERFDFKASSGGLLISDLVVMDMPVNYRTAIKVEGSGTLKNPNIKSRLTLIEGEFKTSPIGGGIVEASLEGRKLSVHAKVIDDTVEIKGGVLLEGDMPWSAEMKLKRGRYDFLIGHYLKSRPDDLLFSVGGRAELKGTRKSLNALAILSSVNLNMFGRGFVNDSEIEVSLENKKLIFSKFSMKSGDASFKMKGSVELEKYYDIDIEGSSSLALLGVFFEGFESMRGTSDFILGIQGDWEDPTITGGLSLSDGTIAFQNIPQQISSINGYVYIDDNRAVIQELGAEIGGGYIELTGFVYLDGLRPEKIYLDTLINDVSVTLARGFSMNVGGNLLFRGAEKGQDITGELRVNRAKYLRRLEWKSWLLETGRKAAARAKADWEDNLKLNIKVVGTENIILDNNIASAPLSVDMIVRGTIDSPLLFGRIEASEGKVYFRNSEFRIMRMTADYADTKYSDPYMDMMAETSIKGYHIWLNLTGNIDQFDLRLSSDPSLDEVEILSLLTLGEFGENIAGLEGGIGAAEATYFMTGKLQDVFEERFTEITGFDRFQVDPYVSRSTGTVTPRVMVSKKLMGEKLFVTYATTGSEQELKMEYILGKNISLLGGQDERGSIGGDIKFRFQFD